MPFDSPDPRAVAASLRELPPPDAVASAHSAELVALIRAAIDEAGGAIGFDRFMQLALYAPGLGYYSAGSRKFGAAGDFVTAPELSPLFSRCVARQCEQVLRRLDGGELLEFGAGSGTMAADILLELERRDALPERYLILEVSADLRQRQQQTLQQRAPQLAARAAWLERPPAEFSGVVLANEVLDAMPVHRLRLHDGTVQELGVCWRDEGFAWQTLDRATPAAVERLRQIMAQQPLAEGYETEVNLAAEGWVRDLAGWLRRGMALLFDYGFPQREFYHPQRGGGTLMCHYRHRAHADPLILAGLQDITAHVDFTAVAEAALSAGLDVAGFANQANFLLGSGLPELAATGGDARAQLEAAAQMKRLLLPGEMGELFKVLALTRGVAGPWDGFAVRDDRGRL